MEQHFNNKKKTFLYLLKRMNVMRNGTLYIQHFATTTEKYKSKKKIVDKNHTKRTKFFDIIEINERDSIILSNWNIHNA